MRDYDDDDKYYEAQQEAAADAAYEHLYNEVGKQWKEDHIGELREELRENLREESYEEAVDQFTSQRLQSYYLAHPDLAAPARASLLYSQSLMPAFPKAALVFAVTATELTVKTVLLKPIIIGLVHTEHLASFIADLTTKHTGMDRFHTLLTEILSHLGGVALPTLKRTNSNKTLWEEFTEVQNARNALIHRGETSDSASADLAISVAGMLLNEIFPKIVSKLGLHLDSSMNICKA